MTIPHGVPGAMKPAMQGLYPRAVPNKDLEAAPCDSLGQTGSKRLCG